MFGIVPAYVILIDWKLAMNNYADPNLMYCRSQWPRCLRLGSAAARLLGLRVRIPPWAWMPVSCEYCVVSYRSLRRADHSSREVLPSVLCLNIIVNLLQ